jgi:Mor family transcriptional regulator
MAILEEISSQIKCQNRISPSKKVAAKVNTNRRKRRKVISAESRARIIKLYLDGATMTELASRFKVGYGAIWNIVRKDVKVKNGTPEAK